MQASGPVEPALKIELSPIGALNVLLPLPACQVYRSIRANRAAKGQITHAALPVLELCLSLCQSVLAFVPVCVTVHADNCFAS